MNNIWGLIISYGLIGVVITLSTMLQKKHFIAEEGARKLIHIGVANWWILAMFFFDHWIYASIPPMTFILLNYASYRMNLVKAMERGGKGSLGTVYYPISLLILVVFSFYLIDAPYVGAIGILVMGYGDGLSAVIGSRWGKTKLIFNKSLQGSLTMFVVSFLVIVTILSIYAPVNAVWISLLLSVIATLVELFTPRGLDNLSVPLVTSFAYYLLFLL